MLVLQECNFFLLKRTGGGPRQDVRHSVRTVVGLYVRAKLTPHMFRAMQVGLERCAALRNALLLCPGDGERQCGHQHCRTQGYVCRSQPRPGHCRPILPPHQPGEVSSARLASCITLTRASVPQVC
jgi:hypothetical protein